MITTIETINQPEFKLVGISVRTTNQNGQSQKDIGDLWTRFMNEGLLQQINDRASDDTYTVYTDYETDYTGFYTAVLGCRVNTFNDVPRGFTSTTVHSGKYRVYSLAGKFPENVHLAWQEIWKSDISRAYSADFDLYTADPKSFEETEAKIYLAVN